MEEPKLKDRTVYFRNTVERVKFRNQVQITNLLSAELVQTGVKLETTCMKHQILFSGKNKKKILNMSSAENFTHSSKR